MNRFHNSCARALSERYGFLCGMGKLTFKGHFGEDYSDTGDCMTGEIILPNMRFVLHIKKFTRLSFLVMFHQPKEKTLKILNLWGEKAAQFINNINVFNNQNLFSIKT